MATSTIHLRRTGDFPSTLFSWSVKFHSGATSRCLTKPELQDRFVNGDPTNDNANGTVFEHDPNDTQMRHGGDTAGLVDTLDYIQGMGIKVSIVTTTGTKTGPDTCRASTSQVHHSSTYLGSLMHTLPLIYHSWIAILAASTNGGRQ